MLKLHAENSRQVKKLVFQNRISWIIEFSEGILFHHILVAENIPSKLIQAIKNVFNLNESRSKKSLKIHPVSPVFNMVERQIRSAEEHSSMKRKKCKTEEKSTTNNYVNLRNYFWQACALKFFRFFFFIHEISWNNLLFSWANAKLWLFRSRDENLLASQSRGMSVCDFPARTYVAQ